MVLPASPVCCESEFFGSDRYAQAPTEAAMMQNAAATGNPMCLTNITCSALELSDQIQTRAQRALAGLPSCRTHFHSAVFMYEDSCLKLAE
jgi:hypothetical protein